MEAGTDYLNTPNMAFNVNGSFKINNVLPPFSELDNLPYYDYDLNDRFLLDEELLQMTKERFKKHYVFYPFGAPTFILITSGDALINVLIVIIFGMLLCMGIPPYDFKVSTVLSMNWNMP